MSGFGGITKLSNSTYIWIGGNEDGSTLMLAANAPSEEAAKLKIRREMSCRFFERCGLILTNPPSWILGDGRAWAGTLGVKSDVKGA